MVDLRDKSVPELLSLFAGVIEALRQKGVLRSRNNPVGDYAEWLVAQAYDLCLQPNSTAGYDAVDSNGVRYQIKGRRLHSSNTSRQLSVIRNLEYRNFDFLVGVLFNHDFSVLEAYKIPHSLIADHSRFSDHQHGHIMFLKGRLLSAEGVDRIDGTLRAYSTQSARQ